MNEMQPATRRCVGCGYDLAGLDGEGALRCPECATEFDVCSGPFISSWPPLREVLSQFIQLVAKTSTPMAMVMTIVGLTVSSASQTPQWTYWAFLLGIVGFGL